MLQRSFDGAHTHLSRSVQCHFAGKAFLEWAESDDELGNDLSRVLVMNPRAAAPGDEQGIVFDVRHDVEKARRHYRVASPAPRDAAYLSPFDCHASPHRVWPAQNAASLRELAVVSTFRLKWR